MSNSVPYREGWPAPVEDLEDLKELAQELDEEFPKGWFWNSYSNIDAPVEKGHITDDSITLKEIESWGWDTTGETEEPGMAHLMHINQIPSQQGRGDELHHPLPRKIAHYIETVQPRYILELIEKLEKGEM